MYKFNAMIEKLPYTNGEKAAEIISCVVTAGAVGGYIVLFALGKTTETTGAAIMMIPVTLILYGVCTLCSTAPQHTNVFTRPENASEKQLRIARRAFILGKILFVAAMFAVTAVGSVL